MNMFAGVFIIDSIMTFNNIYVSYHDAVVEYSLEMDRVGV